MTPDEPGRVGEPLTEQQIDEIRLKVAARFLGLIPLARLREQLGAVRALAADPCLAVGCTANCREHIDALDVLAILKGK